MAGKLAAHALADVVPSRWAHRFLDGAPSLRERLAVAKEYAAGWDIPLDNDVNKPLIADAASPDAFGDRQERQ
jgi:hypothetical protein